MAEHKERINSHTSLSKIKDSIMADFGVSISTQAAKEIKAAAANGTLLWNGQQCATAGGIKIVPGKQLA